jgi:hypothetical protein
LIPSASGASSPRERAEPTELSGITCLDLLSARRADAGLMKGDLMPRPSLEQLQKQAKELLRQHRAQNPAALARLALPSPKLADAQFAIARESGFPTWAALKRHVESQHPSDLEQFEQLAQSLADAYASGDAKAIRQINSNYGTAFVREAASESYTPELALAGARKNVAHAYGFESWTAFVESVSQPPRDPRSAPVFLSSTPPFYQIDWRDNRITVRGPQSPADWETICGIMREHRIAKLTAGRMIDAAMKPLSRLDHVTHLQLGGNALTDTGACRLARMTQLEDLEFGGWTSPLTDRALEPLRHLTALKHFKSTWSQHISDTGLANLAFCPNLERVNLLGTPAGDGTLQALAGKPRLRRFHTGRGVTDAGLRLLHQFPVFASWHGGAVKYELMSFEVDPNFLLLDGPFTDAGLASLAGLDGLFGLSFFWHCPSFTSAGLEALRHLPKLTFLGCQDQHCDDEAMRHVAAVPGLRMLMGQGAVATDAGFAALSRSPTIEYIWGRECPNLTGPGFAALAAMPALRGLAVSCKNVDDAALAALPQSATLRQLMPMDVPDAGFRHIGRCENLENLWCMYCRDTGDTATEHLAGLTRLKSYYAGMTRITDRSLEILSNLSTLERLEFWQCAALTDSGIARLARLPRLRELTLDGLPGVTRAAPALFPNHVRVTYSP